MPTHDVISGGIWVVGYLHARDIFEGIAPRASLWKRVHRCQTVTPKPLKSHDRHGNSCTDFIFDYIIYVYAAICTKSFRLIFKIFKTSTLGKTRWINLEELF